ncbi:MAG: transglycosylase SLT domain-containing protein [Myxococcota bacterium]
MTARAFMLPLVLLLAAPAVEPTLQVARRWLRLQEPVKALATLREGALGAPSTNPAHNGVLALAASGAGERALAQQALEALRGVELPPLARLALDARLLGVCGDCRVGGHSAAEVMAAPVMVQARYLTGLVRVDVAAARALAKEIMRKEAWRDDDAPPHERAELLSAVYTALEVGGDRKAADEVMVTAWQLLPMEPALGYLVRPLLETDMIARHGVAAGVLHLEGLQAANRNHEVLGLGARLCKNVVVQDKRVCPALEKPLGCRVAFAVGKALRQRRKYEDAERTLGAVADGCPELAERALYLGARAAMAQKGGGPRAIALLDRLATGFPQSNLADDALVLAGETAARIEDPDRARRYWQRAEGLSQGDMMPQAAWWLAWSAIDAGRHDEARERLETIVKRNVATDPVEWRRAAYWRARLSKDPAMAISGMEEIVRREPLSFEAAMARGFLRSQGVGVPAAPAFPTTKEVTPASLDALASAGMALWRLGMDDDAAAMLRASLNERAANGKTAPSDVDVVQMLLAAGDAPHASRWIRKRWRDSLHGFPTDVTARVWRVAYPLAHEEAISTAAKDSGVPAPLLFALAREESAFDHAVTSLSGAVGLMQLVPPTALTEAMTLKMELNNEAELRDPYTNARLGAAYLMRNLRQFHGNAALALAAYNAGPGSVHKWLKADPEAPLDLYVERIPIAETRDYVKRVLESYSVYLALHQGGTPLELPLRAADAMVPVR